MFQSIWNFMIKSWTIAQSYAIPKAHNSVNSLSRSEVLTYVKLKDWKSSLSRGGEAITTRYIIFKIHPQCKIRIVSCENEHNASRLIRKCHKAKFMPYFFQYSIPTSCANKKMSQRVMDGGWCICNHDPIDML